MYTSFINAQTSMLALLAPLTNSEPFDSSMIYKLVSKRDLGCLEAALLTAYLKKINSNSQIVSVIVKLF